MVRTGADGKVRPLVRGVCVRSGQTTDVRSGRDGTSRARKALSRSQNGEYSTSPAAMRSFSSRRRRLDSSGSDGAPKTNRQRRPATRFSRRSSPSDGPTRVRGPSERPRSTPGRGWRSGSARGPSGPTANSSGARPSDSRAARTPLRRRSATSARPAARSSPPPKPRVERPHRATVIRVGGELGVVDGQRPQPPWREHTRAGQSLRGAIASGRGERIRPQQPA